MVGSIQILYENVAREIVTLTIRTSGGDIPSWQLKHGEKLIAQTPDNLTTKTWTVPVLGFELI